MEEQLVTFEVARLAKDKGFNEPCYHYYTVGGLDKVKPITGTEYKGYCNSEIERDACLSIPTQSLLQKWLREKHDIHVEVNAYINPNRLINELQYEKIISNNTNAYGGSFENCITRLKTKNPKLFLYNSHEEALEEGLKQALKTI